MRKDHNREKIIDQVDHAAHDKTHEPVEKERDHQVIRIFFPFTLPPVHVDPALVHF
jgi:hypothetical protein